MSFGRPWTSGRQKIAQARLSHCTASSISIHAEDRASICSRNRHRRITAFARSLEEGREGVGRGRGGGGAGRSFARAIASARVQFGAASSFLLEI